MRATRRAWQYKMLCCGLSPSSTAAFYGWSPPLEYDLKESLLRGIYSYGFEKPSAFQQRGIKPLLDGRDTIGQAQSGTGKTATFIIGVLQRATLDHARP